MTLAAPCRKTAANSRRGNQSGFTLLELVLASVILTVVVVGVFSTMTVAMRALDTGTRSLDLYQGARIGLARIQQEIQNAISPESQWKPPTEYYLDQEQIPLQGLVEEEDHGGIVFEGSAGEIRFVRRAYTIPQVQIYENEDSGDELSLDLQEIRLFHDSTRSEVRLEVVRHLTDVRKAEWYWAMIEGISLDGIVAPGENSSDRRRYRRVGSEDELLLEDLVGDIGWDGTQTSMMDHITEVAFSYYGESGWTQSWDSKQVIVERRFGKQRDGMASALDNEMTVRELGLPTAVSVSVRLSNGDQLGSYINIVASSLNQLAADDTRRSAPGVRQGGAQAGSGAGAGPDLAGGGRSETPSAVPR